LSDSQLAKHSVQLVTQSFLPEKPQVPELPPVKLVALLSVEHLETLTARQNASR
jgi:hypothetical protein